jgi:hypothetical protein
VKSSDLLIVAGSVAGLGVLLLTSSEAEADSPPAEPTPNPDPPVASVQLVPGRRYTWTIESSVAGDHSGAFAGLGYQGANLKLVGYPNAVAQSIPGTNVTVDVPGTLVQLAANATTARSVPLMQWRSYGTHQERILSVKDAGPAN